MIVFAIRQKSTGFYLPNVKGRKGGTYVTPKADCIPRLFKQERSAKVCLNWWLRGEVQAELETDEWSREQYSSGPGDVKPVPSRIPEDMEVVKMCLAEVTFLPKGGFS